MADRKLVVIDGVATYVDLSQADLDQQAADVVAFAALKKIILFAQFIGRWSDAEYTLLLQRRATAITNGNITLVRQWDQAMANGVVDLNTAAAQNFKAAIVSANILTQQRADVIFG